MKSLDTSNIFCTKTRSNERGFTVFAVAILVAVAGMAIAALIPDFISSQSSKIIETQKRLQVVRDAIYTYALVNSNAIPCPSASLTTGLTSANPPAAATSCGTTTVQIGAVPTQTLGLSEDAGLDAWGNKIRYAVDPKYTSAPVPSNGLSNLVVQGNGNNPRYLNGKNFYNGGSGQVPIALLISSGPNGAGAYLSSGVMESSADPNSIEYENVDHEILAANDSSDNNADGINETVFVVDSMPATGSSLIYDDVIEGVFNLKNCVEPVSCANTATDGNVPVGCVAGLGRVTQIAEGQNTHGTQRAVTCAGAGAPVITCTDGNWVVAGGSCS